MNEVFGWIVVAAIAAGVVMAFLRWIFPKDSPPPPDYERAWRETQEDMAAQERMARKDAETRRRDEEDG